MRSHDQFNTTIYSNDDRCRGLKGLRTFVFVKTRTTCANAASRSSTASTSPAPADGTTRVVYGYRAVRFESPRGCAAGYMRELNVLCGIADVSSQSDQPVTKRLRVEVVAARSR